MEDQRKAVVESIEVALAAGDSTKARSILNSEGGLFSAEHPAPHRLLLRVIRDLHDAKLYDESVPLMEQLLNQSSTPQPTVRLKLAQILYQFSKRPGRALEVLKDLPEQLPAKQAQQRERLTHLANKVLGAM